MKILSIDPGLSCGWACVNAENPATCSVKLYFFGTWNLKGNRFEGAGFRFLRFKNYLETICINGFPDFVVYEEIRKHLGTDAAHCYGGIVAHLQAWCEEKKIPYSGVPVGTIKKHATGKGNADKETMIQAAKKLWEPEVEVENSDEADALFLLRYACQNILSSK